MYNDNLIFLDVKTYDTYFEKTQNQDPESVYAGKWNVWASVLLNRTMMENGAADFAETLLSLWMPSRVSIFTELFFFKKFEQKSQFKKKIGKNSKKI
jgi:hypothetical protein